MAELIADQTFYLNASQTVSPDATVPALAEIKVNDSYGILKSRDKWQCGVSRFSLSGQTSLFYRPQDNTATATISIFRTDGNVVMGVRDPYTVTLDRNIYTVNDLLTKLNAVTEGPRVVFAVDGTGRYTMSFVTGNDAQDGGRRRQAVAGRFYFASVTISGSLCKVMGFKSSTTAITYHDSHLQLVGDMISFLGQNVNAQVYDDVDSGDWVLYSHLWNLIVPTFSINELGVPRLTIDDDAAGHRRFLQFFDDHETLCVEYTAGTPPIHSSRQYFTAEANHGVGHAMTFHGNESSYWTGTASRVRDWPDRDVVLTNVVITAVNVQSFECVAPAGVQLIPGHMILVRVNYTSDDDSPLYMQYTILRANPQQAGGQGGLYAVVVSELTTHALPVPDGGAVQQNHIESFHDAVNNHNDYQVLYSQVRRAPQVRLHQDIDYIDGYDIGVAAGRPIRCIEGDVLRIEGNVGGGDGEAWQEDFVVTFVNYATREITVSEAPNWDGTNDWADDPIADVDGIVFADYYNNEGRNTEAYELEAGLVARSTAEIQYMYGTMVPHIVNNHDIIDYTEDLDVPDMNDTKMSANVVATDLIDPSFTEVVRGEPIRFTSVALATATTLGASGNMFWRISAPAEWLAFLGNHLDHGLRIQFLTHVVGNDGAAIIDRDDEFSISDVDGQYIHFVKTAWHSDVTAGLHTNINANIQLPDLAVQDRVVYRVIAPRHSRIYELLQLQGHDFDISSGGDVRMTRDSLVSSAYSAQVDTAAYFSRLNIVSASLQTVAERDYSFNARLPIVTSYKLPAAFQASCTETGVISSFNSQPYGQLDFTAVAPRKMHELVGGWEMRAIEIQAELIPKHGGTPVNVMLGPGQHFSIQLVFQKRP